MLRPPVDTAAEWSKHNPGGGKKVARTQARLLILRDNSSENETVAENSSSISGSSSSTSMTTFALASKATIHRIGRVND